MKTCFMCRPLSKATDCVLHRHFAQLTCTRELFARETSTLARMCELGVSSEIGGALLYVDDEKAEFFELPQWWIDRGHKILEMVV